MEPSSGPFVISALVCDKAEVDDGGAVSVSRVVDTITLLGVPPEDRKAPITFDPPRQVWLVVMLVAGAVRGRHKLVIRVEQPDGRETTEGTEDVVIDPGAEDHARFAKRVPITFQKVFPGTTWITLLFDGRVVSRSPVLVTWPKRPVGAGAMTVG